MKYAVVSFSGRQYKVSEGAEVLFDNLGAKDGDKIKISDVLLVCEDGKSRIGTPTVSGVVVTGEVMGMEKGEKIEVIKFKAKARYRRHTGFRPQYTRVKIERITTSN